MNRVIYAVLLALMPVLTAAAAEPRIPAAKKKLILKLFEVTDAKDNTTDAIIDILGGRLGVPPIPEDQRAEMREEGEEMQQVTEQTQMAVYDRYFTEKQLRDLIAFFKTDTGRHYVEVARKMAIETRTNLRAAATMKVQESEQEQRAARTRNQLRAFGAALAAYRADNKSYPPGKNIDDLAAALAPKYMFNVPREDAWGRMFQYEGSGDGQHYRIVSSGIDGKIASASASLQTAADANSYGDDLVFIDGKFVHGGDPVYKQ
ncbi:MAG: hypothetical protein DMF57_14710 [Acidobacteria bacterium]|nr:MAG: hypothetical protein DMF57_14710 [Acidobacteriota bacterium]